MQSRFHLPLNDRRAFANARSVAMKRSSIGTIRFTGSAAGWPVSRASASA
jgi:hypothetical protein